MEIDIHALLPVTDFSVHETVPEQAVRLSLTDILCFPSIKEISARVFDIDMFVVRDRNA